MSLTGRKEGRKEGRVRREWKSLSLSLSHELPGPRTVGMRSYPWKTSKLRLERLKLFPRTTPENPWCSLADWFFHEYLDGHDRTRRGVCPPPPSSANSSIVFCRQQITFRHVCSIRYPSSPRFFPQNPTDPPSFFTSILQYFMRYSGIKLHSSKISFFL